MTEPTRTCHDCGVSPGRYHQPDCDVERCPYCGGQLVSCGCRRRPPLDDRMPWAGVWPGVAECREFGWFARPVPGQGWVPCGPDEPDAVEDLNRLAKEGRWDRRQKRFVRRERQDP